MSTPPLSPEEFAVGDVAILCNLVVDVGDNGREVVIHALPASHDWLRFEDGRRVYAGMFSILLDGKYVATYRRNLRKKRPPAKDRDVVRWADCPWQPEVLRV